MMIINKKTLFTICLCFLVLTTLCVGMLTSQYQISSQGNIETINLAAFIDQNCTQQLTSIAWGTLIPGQNTSYCFYIQNTGCTAEICTLTSTTWNPANAANYLSCSWSFENGSLNAGQFMNVTVTLTVADNITGISSFSNIILLIGTAE